MKLKYILSVLALCLFALACKKEEISLYKSDLQGVYFQQGTATSYTDSTAFSFDAAPPATNDTIINVRIRTMGNVKDYPRTVKLSIEQENTTAVKGTHYDLDLNSIVIPAGASQAFVPVKVHRTSDLLTNRFSIMLKLEANEYFDIPFTMQKNTSVFSSVGAQIKADRYKITVGEIYTEPFYWTNFGPQYFGPWTITKYKFVNSVLGWTSEDWATAGSSSSRVLLGRFGPGAIAVRNALQALADAGTPLMDENGSPMQLGAAYQVIY